MKDFSPHDPHALITCSVEDLSIPKLLRLSTTIDTALSLLGWTPRQKEKNLSPEEQTLKEMLEKKKQSIHDRINTILKGEEK